MSGPAITVSFASAELRQGSLLGSSVIDAALLGLFAVPHSAMARQGIKR